METCQRCGDEGEDRRTLWMACFYAMDELSVPFEEMKIDDIDGFSRRFFTLRVCKNCRGDWMETIEKWFRTFIRKHEPNGMRNIPVRIKGRVVFLTKAEFDNREEKRSGNIG